MTHRVRQSRRDRGVVEFDELKRVQGLPAEYDLPGMTVKAKCKAVGNGVPIAMGRAMARAVRGAAETQRKDKNNGSTQ